MISGKKLTSEKEGLLSLRSLVEVYQEIAAVRMQRVRGAVLQSRQFLAGLEEVFARVRAAYSRKISGRRMARSLALKKNGRLVTVFVSANSGLYGEIVGRTFETFVNFVRENKPDVVILGKLGVKMMADRLPDTLYNYFDFADDQVDPESFGLVMRYLIQFERIVVFHGRFRSIVSQEPVATGVSGEAVERISQETPAERVEYLFEPSVDQIARIFEGEILGSLFEQALHESQLAKFASRLMALDRSIESVDRRLEAVRVEGGKLRHKARNRKQLTTISGIHLWAR